MTNHLVRVYAAVVSLGVLFALWVVIAASPWSAGPAQAVDPRLVALKAREQRLRHEAATVQRTVQRRWHAYEHRLRARRQEIAAARRRHAAQLASALRAQDAREAALAAIAAQRASGPTPIPVSAAAAAPATPPAPAVATPPRVVVLPPKVRVVSLPPVAVTASS